MASRYRLKDGYLLRGWEKLPYAVVEPRTKSIRFVPKDMMRVLMRCNGEWDFDSILTLQEERDCVSKAVSQGFVEACEEGCGISPEQQYRFYPNRFMQTIHWAITGKCNYRCRHCFMSAPEGQHGQLSHEAVMDIARQIGECGILRVSLTGGEPLLRPDFLEIVEEITRQGSIITQLYTNGSLVTEEVLDGLSALGQHPDVIMSFDGVGHHDWLRGVNGAERAADAAFRLCAAKGFTTQAQMCLHKNNLESLRETVNYLASVGCGFIRVGHVNDIGDWRVHGKGTSLTQEEYLQACLRYIPEYYADGMPMAIILSGVFAASPKNPDSFRIVPCHSNSDNPERLVFSCTRQTMQLYPDARPALCEELDSDFVGSLPIVSDNPAQQTTSLREVLSTGSPYLSFMDITCEQLFNANEECACCPYLRLCGAGCRASAQKTCGSLFGKDPETCSFFRNGWVNKVIDAVTEARPNATCSLINDPLFISK